MNNLTSKQRQSHQILISLDKLEIWVVAKPMLLQDFLQRDPHHIGMTAVRPSISAPVPVPGPPQKSRDRNLLGNTNTNPPLLILS
jgi:hypothetical protein